MAYKKRFDDRDFDETRPASAEVDVIPNADGSAKFKIGDTIAYAAVYGPRELHPSFLQNPTKGLLRCKYNMLPFSGSGDRVRPGGGRRAKEISMITENALIPVLDLSSYPNTVVDVFIEFPQTDAGTRCAGISAASMALAHAGLEMEDMVSSVAVGKVDDQVLVDLSYDEEAYEDGDVADIPVAYIPSKDKFTLLQMDGLITPDELKKALKMARKACKDIHKVQTKAIKEKYK